MSKATLVTDLVKSYNDEQLNRSRKAHATYKNKHKDRWLEVMTAHNRKKSKKARKSVGKSNKMGARLTAKSLARTISEIDFLAAICRSNRNWHKKNHGEAA